MLFSTDKRGLHPHPHNLLNGFRNVVEDSALLELDLFGGSFTWEKNRGMPDWVMGILDGAFATMSWWSKFPLCKLFITHTVYSNHDPIHLELMNPSFIKKQFCFQFENTWLKEVIF